jgi:hypothetical protein
VANQENSFSVVAIVMRAEEHRMNWTYNGEISDIAVLPDAIWLQS